MRRHDVTMLRARARCDDGSTLRFFFKAGTEYGEGMATILQFTAGRARVDVDATLKMPFACEYIPITVVT